jgi:uncharacterized protein (DUF2342 family)
MAKLDGVTRQPTLQPGETAIGGVDAVVAEAGMGALEQLWTSEDQLPTLDELRTPQRWLARVA